MKKLLTLLAILTLGYFVSIGCVYKNSSAPPHIKDKIVSAYHDSDNVVLVGDKYILYFDGSHSENDARKPQDEIAIFSQIVNQEGAYVYIYEDVASGGLRSVDNGVAAELGVSIMIDIDESNASLLSWAENQTRQVVDRYEGDKAIYKDEKLFFQEGKFLKSFVTLSGEAYKRDSVYFDSAPKLDTPFTVSFSDFGIGNMKAFPQALKEREQQARVEGRYIHHIGIKMHPAYKEPDAKQVK